MPCIVRCSLADEAPAELASVEPRILHYEGCVDVSVPSSATGPILAFDWQHAITMPLLRKNRASR